MISSGLKMTMRVLSPGATLVGGGTEYNQLLRFFDNTPPRFARLLSHLPQHEFDGLCASCDVGLIFLDHRFSIPNFPSRLLSYMQARLPVLAATDANTDLGHIIEEGKFGLWCESTSVEAFMQQVQKLCDTVLRKQMGKTAREFLEKHYTARHSYNIIMHHFGGGAPCLLTEPS